MNKNTLTIQEVKQPDLITVEGDWLKDGYSLMRIKKQKSKYMIFLRGKIVGEVKIYSA